jgi:two-component system OmpR family response regulator/two-component system response regulator QseB
MGNSFSETHQRVLLVEDDTATADMYRLGLEMSGYVVDVAADGVSALRVAIEEHKTDVVVLDLGLPRMGGIRVLAALQESGFTADIPVIVLSNDTEDFPAALGAGAIQCLTKSRTTPAELSTRIRGVAAEYLRGA